MWLSSHLQSVFSVQFEKEMGFWFNEKARTNTNSFCLSCPFQTHRTMDKNRTENTIKHRTRTGEEVCTLFEFESVPYLFTLGVFMIDARKHLNLRFRDGK